MAVTRAAAGIAGQAIRALGRVHACAVTPDVRPVVSGSEDGTLKVWDLASGRAEATLEGTALG